MYKMMFGLLSLFVIFIISSWMSLNFLHNPEEFIHDPSKVSLYLYIRWFLLILGFLTTGITVVWWLRHGREEKKSFQEVLAIMNAINRSQATIEFNPDGTIITANDKFLDALGYTLSELQGKHHSILVDKENRRSDEYKELWDKLNRGEYQVSEYKRVKKNGEPVWLQSSYNPILDENGKIVKIIKIATDITTRKHQEERLAKLTEKLRDVLQRIASDSNAIAAGINQLQTTANAQVASASEQASSITEISTTMDEIKTTTKQTHEKAKELGESASQTSKEAEKGKIAIDNMAESMHNLQQKMEQISNTILGLNDKTQQISEITETVADIARQSKLLALNASIEAAKAGESGKGFAVVAGEVKDLAEKSQLSTERVQKILQDIRNTAEQAVMVTEEGNKGVEESIRQVNATGKIISTLGDVIEKSSLASLQIVSAVREEAIAIDQINLSMKEVDKVTSVFNSAAEQTAEAITSLGQVSESLKNTANQYKEE